MSDGADNFVLLVIWISSGLDIYVVLLSSLQLFFWSSLVMVLWKPVSEGLESHKDE